VRVAIVSDAWHPQVNGVVRTLERTRDELRGLGHSVRMITPEGCRTVPLPTYPEIRLALRPGKHVKTVLQDFDAEAIHIATEGPLGMAARAWCRRRGLPFTTSLHTRFPEYVNLRVGVPLPWGYAWLRWFHGAAARTLVTTTSMQRELAAWGIGNTAIWGRGVDTELFRPDPEARLDAARPVFLYVGRVAVEKNVEDFLSLDLPGNKVVVGDGPDLGTLRTRYPQVLFKGYRTGRSLAQCYAAADVFVFPSRTDTFGLVLLEAMACGTPVAAYPVPGPQDVIVDGRTGRLDEDLRHAALSALNLDRSICHEHAKHFSWRKSTGAFVRLLQPVHRP
jgi:glycosyltransferase involved in cell wall biosynthesis